MREGGDSESSELRSTGLLIVFFAFDELSSEGGDANADSEEGEKNTSHIGGICLYRIASVF
jgi:hypothetical protein